MVVPLPMPMMMLTMMTTTIVDKLLSELFPLARFLREPRA